MWTKNFSTYSDTKGITGAVGRLKALANDVTAPMFEGNKFDLFQETLKKKKILLTMDSESYPPEAKKLMMKILLEGAWTECQKIDPRENDHKNGGTGHY